MFKLTKLASLGVNTSPFRDKYEAYLGEKVYLFEQAEIPEIKQLGRGASINSKGEGRVILSPVGIDVKNLNISARQPVLIAFIPIKEVAFIGGGT